jgi:PAS domain S-box-containing protein
LIFYFISKKSINYNESFIKIKPEIDNSNEQFRLFFIFIGVSLPIMELVVEITNTRDIDTRAINLMASSLFITLYFLSKKFNFIYKNLQFIVPVLFILYGCSTIFHLIEFPEVSMTSIEFILMFFLSYSIFKSIVAYRTFIVVILITLITLNANNLLSTYTTVTLLCYCFLIAIINHARHIVFLNTKYKLLFSDNVVNKGNSLVLAVNLKGEVVYCSNSIKSILGYDSNEVMGMNFWKLTQDSEFSTNSYEINKDLYIRKLKCKDETYKFIQWKDSKYSDEILVGIGQDVTEQVQIQNQYKNLIENASEMVFETDSKGNMTFINNFAIKTMGYSENEIIGKPFVFFIREDYKQKIFDYYSTIHLNEANNITEFPIIKKDGSRIWISQQVSVKRNDLGKINGFFSFSRDVTYIKKLDKENAKRDRKKALFNEVVKNLSTKVIDQNTEFESLLNNILLISSNTLDVNRAGYWNYNPQKIECQNLIEFGKNIFAKPIILKVEDYPKYFRRIEKKSQIATNDSKKNLENDIFDSSYTNANNIKSWIDTPVFSEGKLIGILSFETITKYKSWDNEDCDFARSISDLIGLQIETQKRIDAENKLLYKGELLTAITEITTKFLNSKTIEETFDETLKIIGKVANADRAYYFENNHAEKTVSQKYEWTNDKSTAEIDNPDLQKLPHKVFQEFVEILYKNKEYNIIVRTLEKSGYKKTLEDQNILSILIIPIFVKNQLHSFIGFDDCTKERIWTEDEISILKNLANNISTFLDKNINESIISESLNKLNYKSDLLNTITTITNRFSGNSKIDESFNQSLQEIGSVTNVDKVYYFENNSIERTVSLKYEWVSKNSKSEIENPIYQNFSHDNIQKNITILNQNKQINQITSNIEDSDYKKFLLENSILTSLLIPIFIKNKLHSFLAFDDCTKERIWTEDEINILTTFSKNITSAIQKNQNEVIIIENENKIESKNDLLNVIAKNTKQLLVSKNIYEIFNSTLNDIGNVTNISRLTFYKNHYEKNVVEQIYRWIKGSDTILNLNPKSQFIDCKIIEECLEKLRKNQYYFGLETNVKDENFKSILNALEIKAILIIPVFIKNSFYGFITFDDIHKEKLWSYDEISILQTVSNNIASAIERIQNENTIHENEIKLIYKNDLLDVISKNTKQLLTSKNNSEIFDATLNSIGKITNLDRLTFYENQPDKKVFRQRYRWISGSTNILDINPKAEYLPYSEIQEGILILEKNNPFFVVTKDFPEGNLKKLFIQYEIKSILFLPIFVKESFYGYISFDDTKTERIWSSDEISILQTVANSISVAIERNINEAQIAESEEKFRILSDNIPGTVYLSKFDDVSTKLYINNQIKKLTGYPAKDFLDETLSFLTLIHPDDRERVVREQKQSLLENKQFHSTYRIIQKTGKTIWIEEFGDAIRKNNNIEYIGGIFIDISQKIEAENAIKDKQVAEAASKAKSDFLSNMSHEIRTPLNGIIGFTNLLINTKLETVQKQYMTTINQSANSLMEIINDVLDFSKIEAGKLELNIEKNDIQELAIQIVNLMKHQSNEKDLALFLNIDENVPKFLWIDETRLKQIILNLLSNALKFTENGQIIFSISVLENIKKSENIIRFSVKDTGIGIKKINQSHIFNAFSQEDSSTTRKFGGTGLGLSICNQLLGLMNSQMQVESTYKKGSEFFFDLKLKTSSTTVLVGSAIDLTSEKIIKKAKQDYGQENYKILIVEDNKINMLLAKTMVKQIIPNCSIYEVVNGKLAVDNFEIIKPDLVLMDIQMPEMNGYEATEEIRKMRNSEQIPIIALTAGIAVGEKQKCLEAGMNDYISKPIIKETLERIIFKWINK